MKGPAGTGIELARKKPAKSGKEGKTNRNRFLQRPQGSIRPDLSLGKARIGFAESRNLGSSNDSSSKGMQRGHKCNQGGRFITGDVAPDKGPKDGLSQAQ